ncbi:MAG: serine/threonine protein kinase [Planctomycetaceae bacterium]|nr:serine/threonine protein kinase [Planctomycetaceae bacterium]
MDQSTPPAVPAAAEGDTLRQTDEQRAGSRDLSLRTLEAPGVSPGYEIIRRLGTGSFGAVWLAREIKTGKQVAIKFYSHRRGLDWSLLTREVEKLAVLYTSRDIVGLLDVGWDHDPPYFVMEFLEHGSLQSRLQAGRLPVENAVQIATSLARALVHAHGSGILHCDLKPANVLLDGSDEPRLGDFGQSRLTTEQSPALGTMYYMAPEQADLNAVPDARWDVYALGALLYEMLTGTPPHRSEESERRLRNVPTLEGRLAAYRQLIADAPPPEAHRAVKGVDRRLAEIVDGCLKTDPHSRFPNAQVVLDKLVQRTAIRSRRPLLAVGFLGPILFVLAMFWIFYDAVPEASKAAEHNLVQRALVGDSVSALILADSIQRDLAARLERVRTLARSPQARAIARLQDEPPPPGSTVDEHGNPLPFNMQLLNLLEDKVPDHPLQPVYAELVSEIQANEQQLSDSGRTTSASWFIVGTQGRQVFREPARKSSDAIHDSIGNSYHWRAYYTGEDADRPANTALDEVSPRTTPGITRNAFQSTTTKQYMVALAAPIWDERHNDWVREGRQGDDPGTVIGVVASTIHISELLKQWEHTIRDPDQPAGSNERFLALATLSGGDVTLLDHPWMTVENLKKVAPDENENSMNAQLDKFMQGLKLDADVAQRLKAVVAGDQRDDLEAHYRDPFGKVADEFSGEWLAAFARVQGFDWLAIVQERRATAIEPVQRINEIFFQAGCVAIVVFGVLLAILWYFLHRASSRA